MNSSAAISPERLRHLPTKPGVYLMKDKLRKVIYVGKAKNLRTRVRSYFSQGDGRYTVQFLVQKICAIETVVTNSERQALVLEADLIKKYKPRYNVRLKDDKAHYLVRLVNHEWPRLELVRKAENDGARYFGPFVFGYELQTCLEVIKATIPLRTCSDRVIYNRVRPCLEYQIKRCAGPCCIEVDRSQYLHWVEQAIAILEGKNKAVISQLEREMARASEEERYEDAAMVRDRLTVLKRIAAEKPAVEVSFGSRDAIGFYREGDRAELSVMRVRQGRLFGGKTYGFNEVEIPDEELITSFLSQFYTGEEEIPDEIFLPFEIEDSTLREQVYSDRVGHKVKIGVPKIGEKAKLVLLAMSNATENFKGRFYGIDSSDKALKLLQVELELDEMPRSMECVDISHFQGGATVGSVVAFQDGVPEKNRYRRFHLSQEGKPDDFSSIREVVFRHLSRAVEENTVPDMVIIDGGPGQLRMGLAARKELGMSQPLMIALAKKRAERRLYHRKLSAEASREKKPERVYIEGRAVPVVLAAESKALHLLERIRDEAHRFAVSFHRMTRTKKIFQSQLEMIQGVGPKRRKELLKAFGSVRGIREASVEELRTRCGVPEKLGARILESLKGAVE